MTHGTPLAVIKVGGGLLGTSADLRTVAAAIAERRRRSPTRLLVVVSALKGVTDLLLEAAVRALDPRAGDELVRDVVARLHTRHEDFVSALHDADAVRLRLRPTLDGVERLLTGVRLTGELTPRTRDLLVVHGERLAAPLLAAAIVEHATDARAIGAEEAGLVAVGPFGVGRCDLERTAPGLARLEHELHARVLVLTGFYGLDERGDVVTFGRGGTDYTAGVVAAGLEAEALELWKDVPGFLTADPVAVPGARTIAEVSFDEACELGFYGARILHPRCLEPLAGRCVEVSVRPVDPVGEPGLGTRVVERRCAPRHAVAAIAVRRGVAVVRVAGAAMVNTPGVAARVLERVAAAGVNVDAIATSMTSLSFTVDDAHAVEVQRELRLLRESGAAGVDDVTVRRDAALLGVVGDGVAGDARVAARALTCLADRDVPVELVSHGPRDVGLSCTVAGEHWTDALIALHEAFFAATPARP